MKAQLKMAKDGVTKMDGDKFAGVVEPFLEGAKVFFSFLFVLVSPRLRCFTSSECFC